MNPRSRAPDDHAAHGARQNTRLSYVLSIKSAQRELNPRFRLGKAAGCRYILGAICLSRIVKEHRAPDHRCAAVPDSNPRRRITGAVSLPLDDQCNQWDQRDLNPHLAD